MSEPETPNQIKYHKTSDGSVLEEDVTRVSLGPVPMWEGDSPYPEPVGKKGRVWHIFKRDGPGPYKVWAGVMMDQPYKFVFHVWPVDCLKVEI